MKIFFCMLLSFNLFSAGFFSSAKEQADHLWQSVEESRYDKLPPFQALSYLNSFQLLNSDFSSTAYVGDNLYMLQDHKKIIHAQGAIIRVRFDITNPIYPGILSNGSPFGFMRISLATKPEAKSYLPGLALLLFFDGRRPETMLAMPSLEPQTVPNIFLNDYLTSLPEPEFSLGGACLSYQFSKALANSGFSDHSIRAFSIKDLVRTSKAETEVEAPYALVFSPTKESHDLLKGIQPQDDFRERLNGHGNGKVLFEVYAKKKQSSEPELIGLIVATSNYEISKFADETLRFKHPVPMKKSAKDSRYSCSWCS